MFWRSPHHASILQPLNLLLDLSLLSHPSRGRLLPSDPTPPRMRFPLSRRRSVRRAATAALPRLPERLAAQLQPPVHDGQRIAVDQIGAAGAVGEVWDSRRQLQDARAPGPGIPAGLRMNLRDSTRELTDQENPNIVGLTDRASKTNYPDPGTRKTRLGHQRVTRPYASLSFPMGCL